MSRWLKQVNTLLENLDDTVGDAVEKAEERMEERMEMEQGYASASSLSDHDGAAPAMGSAKASVDDILARRGLLEEEEEEEAAEEGEGEGSGGEGEGEGEDDGNHNPTPNEEMGAAPPPTDAAPSSALSTGLEPPSSSGGGGSWTVAGGGAAGGGGPSTEPANRGSSSGAVVDAPRSGSGSGSGPAYPSDSSESAAVPTAVGVGVGVGVGPVDGKARVERGGGGAPAAEEAQKELRRLRRQIVRLNSGLEAAEAEVEAQRTELDRAAERMERDRARHREERERAGRERDEEREAAEAEHRAALGALRAGHAERIADMEGQVRRSDEAREKEGGDWNAELRDALERERDVVKKMVALEDEKQTLLSQVSTLQAQSTSLQSRLESVSETATTASEREREADDRLDAALSLHARQIGQRNSREAELERTVAELGAALAVAKQRDQSRGSGAARALEATAGADQTESSLRSRLDVVEEEFETAKMQLVLEQQRSETLQDELQEITKERTEEASAVQAKQKVYDRKVADMSATISRLQISLRDLTKKNQSSAGPDGPGAFSVEATELNKRVATLSKLVVQHQAKIDDSKVEVSTLKSRLRAANSRAEAAERLAIVSGNTSDVSDLEMGGGLGYATGRMRRRNRGRLLMRSKSIRSALKLDAGRGRSDAQEQIGSIVDALDKWSIETGAYLRSDPIARGVFLTYLVVLHIWAFCLLFFHTHTDLNIDNSFAEGHGPAAIMQQSYKGVLGRRNSP